MFDGRLKGEEFDRGYEPYESLTDGISVSYMNSVAL